MARFPRYSGFYLPKIRTLKSALVVLFVFIFSSGYSQTDYVYEIPERLDDGWKVSSLSAEGMATGKIAKLTNQIRNGRFQGIRSLLIVKNGALVHEAYFNGFDRESLHRIYSITKSMSSTLTGIAIDKKLIDNARVPVLDLLPQYANAVKDKRKREIQLWHLLTMSSGLEWDENSYNYGNERNTHYRMERSRDWLKFVLTLPLKDEPGTKWIYNTGAVHLLSGVIKKASGLAMNEFAEQNLFASLGITKYEWNTDPMGYHCAGGSNGGLRLRTRDLAKIGWLFMNNGKWQDKQVITPGWVREATSKQINAYDATDYGYLWWHGSFKIKGRKIPYTAGFGYGGQALYLVPELDLMFVLTSWGRRQGADTLGPVLKILGAAMQAH